MKSVCFYFLFAFHGLHLKEDIHGKLPCKLSYRTLAYGISLKLKLFLVRTLWSQLCRPSLIFILFRCLIDT